MAHKWFDPVRDDIMREYDKKRLIPCTMVNSEKIQKVSDSL